MEKSGKRPRVEGENKEVINVRIIYGSDKEPLDIVLDEDDYVDTLELKIKEAMGINMNQKLVLINMYQQFLLSWRRLKIYKVVNGSRIFCDNGDQLPTYYRSRDIINMLKDAEPSSDIIAVNDDEDDDDDDDDDSQKPNCKYPPVESPESIQQWLKRPKKFPFPGDKTKLSTIVKCHLVFLGWRLDRKQKKGGKSHLVFISPGPGGGKTFQSLTKACSAIRDGKVGPPPLLPPPPPPPLLLLPPPPPPPKAAGAAAMAGGGLGQAAGCGITTGPLVEAQPGLSGPVRGVGGPSPGMMQPQISPPVIRPPDLSGPVRGVGGPSPGMMQPQISRPPVIRPSGFPGQQPAQMARGPPPMMGQFLGRPPGQFGMPLPFGQRPMGYPPGMMRGPPPPSFGQTPMGPPGMMRGPSPPQHPGMQGPPPTRPGVPPPPGVSVPVYVPPRLGTPPPPGVSVPVCVPPRLGTPPPPNPEQKNQQQNE